MPELPDVEVFKQYLDSTSLHKLIKEVHVLDDRILENISTEQLQNRLRGLSFDETERIGKYLFIKTTGRDKAPRLALHFGMTGSLEYYKENKKQPEYAKVLFHFDTSYYLAYICMRMLGKVGLTDSTRDYISDVGLGPDALQIGYEALSNLLSKGRGTVKSALMNQKMIAGLGNIYTDEILYQAGVHPETKKQDLTDSIIKKLYSSMDYVLQKAIEKNADPDKLPSGFIIHRRHKEGTCPNCGSKLKNIKIGGRSTYFCPRDQQKSSARV